MILQAIEWSERQIAWLKVHYKHTKNADVKEELRKRGLDVSERSICRMAKKLGLRKSAQFRNKYTRDALEKMLEHNRKTGYVGSIKGGIMAGRAEYNKGRFQKGTSPKERFGEERWKEIKAKANRTRNESIRKEKRRIDLGLEQKTSMRLIKRFSEKEINLRYEAHKQGYIVYREEGTIYYSKETVRVPKIEQKLKDNDIVLLPIWMRGKKLAEADGVVIEAGNMIQ